MSVAMIESLLFSSFRLRAVTFPNRIVIAPMQMYKAALDGLATDRHFQHLAKYAVGGAGTVMTEALIVDPIGRNTLTDPHLGAACRAGARHRSGLEQVAALLWLVAAASRRDRHRGLIRKKRTSPWIFGWTDVSCSCRVPRRASAAPWRGPSAMPAPVFT